MAQRIRDLLDGNNVSPQRTAHNQTPCHWSCRALYTGPKDLPVRRPVQSITLTSPSRHCHPNGQAASPVHTRSILEAHDRLDGAERTKLLRDYRLDLLLDRSTEAARPRFGPFLNRSGPWSRWTQSMRRRHAIPIWLRSGAYVGPIDQLHEWKILDRDQTSSVEAASLGIGDQDISIFMQKAFSWRIRVDGGSSPRRSKRLVCSGRRKSETCHGLQSSVRSSRCESPGERLKQSTSGFRVVRCHHAAAKIHG